MSSFTRYFKVLEQFWQNKAITFFFSLKNQIRRNFHRETYLLININSHVQLSFTKCATFCFGITAIYLHSPLSIMWWRWRWFISLCYNFKSLFTWWSHHILVQKIITLAIAIAHCRTYYIMYVYVYIYYVCICVLCICISVLCMYICINCGTFDSI